MMQLTFYIVAFVTVLFTFAIIAFDDDSFVYRTAYKLIALVILVIVFLYMGYIS